jgi:hypothetical protein
MLCVRLSKTDETIVRRALPDLDEFASYSIPDRPLQIITGIGKHSANRIGILGPALLTTLSEDGWKVTKAEGRLVVRGKG